MLVVAGVWSTNDVNGVFSLFFILVDVVLVREQHMLGLHGCWEVPHHGWLVGGCATPRMMVGRGPGWFCKARAFLRALRFQ